MDLVIHKNKTFTLKPKHIVPSDLRVCLRPAQPRPMHIYDQRAWTYNYGVYINRIIMYITDGLHRIRTDGYDLKWDMEKASNYLRNVLYKTSQNTSKRYYFLK